MPPKSLTKNPTLRLLSRCVFFHWDTLTQQWPCPSEQVKFDPVTRNIITLFEVQDQQEHLNKRQGEVESLRPLVEICLDNNPA